MPSEENYYEILGIPINASIEQIKEAYIYKVNILHPDRLAETSERIRSLAENDLKKVNVAYQVLSNPQKRRQYDTTIFGSSNVIRDVKTSGQVKKPRPEVYPKTIYFDKAMPYVKQKGSFFIRNVGGPYKKVLVSEPPEWIRVVKTTSLQDNSKLPMRVHIEAAAVHWNKTYSSEIVVRLDESWTKIKVNLRTPKKPR
jgi:hypothetical protein